nr:hydrogenase nickel incorporation protein HypB [uncultured Holophaga sp.]
MCKDCGCSPRKGRVRRGRRSPEAPERTLQMGVDLLAEVRDEGQRNRELFTQRGVLALNLVSSPGAGKTTLLERTLAELGGEFPFCVIEGDQQTRNDADRIARTGTPVVQINTDRGCHLDAEGVERAFHQLDPVPGSILFIENIGNLVCPALFDLGEEARILISSVAEGDDKPLKYPDMFRSAHLCVITKVDLLPHVPFSLERFRAYALRVNPSLDFLEVSTRSSFEPWYDWLRERSGGYF